jgi:two-component system, sensor histidine kinase PhcS
MAEPNIVNTPEFRAALLANERAERIRTGKVASALVIFLMPAGVTLDFFYYKTELGSFLLVRLLCAALAVGLWYLHTTPWAERNYKLLGLPIAWLPAAGISWMIYVTEGPTSPYYAGLNLILLAISVVVHWNLRESLLAVAGVLLMYSAVALPKADAQQLPIIFNNFYFLVLTGIIVVTGNYIFDRLRFREFLASYELALNRRELEASNHELTVKQGELSLSNSQLSRTKAELEVSNRGLSSQKQQLEVTLEKLRLTQDELVTKEKQASLGVWSAGIIHEINNPLNYVRTGLYALRNVEQHLPEAERTEFKEVFLDIDDGVRRVHDIVSDLRSYAHPGSDQPNLVALEEVVRMALRFCAEDLRGRIEVVQQVPPGFAVYAERNRLIQVLTNLVQNAAHALRQKQFATGHPVITITGREEGGRRLVIVHDNGPGITKVNQEKVFDPFFTTKAPGEGMGLGLGICYRIIQGFGGTIRVKSEPGESCEFTLDLPAEMPDANEA